MGTIIKTMDYVKLINDSRSDLIKSLYSSIDQRSYQFYDHLLFDLRKQSDNMSLYLTIYVVENIYAMQRVGLKEYPDKIKVYGRLYDDSITSWLINGPWQNEFHLLMKIVDAEVSKKEEQRRMEYALSLKRKEEEQAALVKRLVKLFDKNVEDDNK